MSVSIFLDSQLIKKLRLDRGLTQEALGEGVGVEQSVISRAENNKAVKFENAQAIASYFGIPLEDLQARRLGKRIKMLLGERTGISEKEEIHHQLDEAAHSLYSHAELSPWVLSVIQILTSGDPEWVAGLMSNINAFRISIGLPRLPMESSDDKREKRAREAG